MKLDPVLLEIVTQLQCESFGVELFLLSSSRLLLILRLTPDLIS